MNATYSTQLDDINTAEQLEKLAKLLPDGPVPKSLSADLRYADESLERAVSHVDHCRESRAEALRAALGRIRQGWSDDEVRDALAKLDGNE
jgi:hypothetical protein